MNWKTWKALARRHAAYRDLLLARMAEWPEHRINECMDLETLAAVVILTERIERHEERMQRHAARGLASLPIDGERPSRL